MASFISKIILVKRIVAVIFVPNIAQNNIVKNPMTITVDDNVVVRGANKLENMVIQE